MILSVVLQGHESKCYDMIAEIRYVSVLHADPSGGAD